MHSPVIAHLCCARTCCAISAALPVPPASCASSRTSRQNDSRLRGVGTTAYLCMYGSRQAARPALHATTTSGRDCWTAALHAGSCSKQHASNTKSCSPQAAQRDVAHLLRCRRLRSGAASVCGCSTTSRLRMSYVVRTISAAASCEAVTTSLLAAALPLAAVAAAAPRTLLGAGLLLLLRLAPLPAEVSACGWPEYTLMDRLPGRVCRCNSSTHCNQAGHKQQSSTPARQPQAGAATQHRSRPEAVSTAAAVGAGKAC